MLYKKLEEDSKNSKKLECLTKNVPIKQIPIIFLWILIATILYLFLYYSRSIGLITISERFCERVADTKNVAQLRRNTPNKHSVVVYHRAYLVNFTQNVTIGMQWKIRILTMAKCNVSAALGRARAHGGPMSIKKWKPKEAEHGRDADAIFRKTRFSRVSTVEFG